MLSGHYAHFCVWLSLDHEIVMLQTPILSLPTATAVVAVAGASAGVAITTMVVVVVVVAVVR